VSIPGSHDAGGAGTGDDDAAAGGPGDDDGHWVRWHRSYEDPDSPLSQRLRLVQTGVTDALDHRAPGPIQIVSMCAGQGRDVIDVVARHRRRGDVRALLVEQDPALVRFARERAAAAGVPEQVEVVEGDASLARPYIGTVPADVVLICGVFGNISDADIRATIFTMPSFCAPGGTVIWTRHRRPPDLTPSILEWFAEAGFAEQSFSAPAPYVLSVGCHRFVGRPPGPIRGSIPAGASPSPGLIALDPELRLFTFIGDGSLPA